MSWQTLFHDPEQTATLHMCMPKMCILWEYIAFQTQGSSLRVMQGNLLNVSRFHFMFIY